RGRDPRRRRGARAGRGAGACEAGRLRHVTRGSSLLRQREFSLYLVGNVARIAASQIVAVGVGWQVYSIHKNPFDLGLVGIAEFLPVPLLALPSGQLARRYSRRLVVALANAISLVATALLLVVTLTSPDRLWPFLVLAALGGAATSLGSPAARALPPELVAAEDLGTAFALRSTSTQLGIVAGPAAGGLLFAIPPEPLYAAAPARGTCRAGAARDRDAVRRRDDRLRPLALVRALARRARRLRLRRHDQRQHPLDDSGLRDAERAPRTGQRGRMGLHRRLESA